MPKTMNLEHADDDELTQIIATFGRLRYNAECEGDWTTWKDYDDMRADARAELDKRRKEASQ